MIRTNFLYEKLFYIHKFCHGLLPKALCSIYIEAIQTKLSEWSSSKENFFIRQDIKIKLLLENLNQWKVL